MNDKNLIFTIFTDKKEYHIGESIELNGTLKNITVIELKEILKNIENIDILINKNFCLHGNEIMKGMWGIALKIITPRNELLKFMTLYEMEGPNLSWFLVLNPNESFTGRIGDLKEFCKEKGTYKIQAYYYNYKEIYKIQTYRHDYILGDISGIKNVWHGTLPSNEIQITIK